MKQSNNKLFSDVEELLQQSVIAQASSEIWTKFERAVEKLDPDAAGLLMEHFQGKSATALAKKKGIPATEMESLLKQTKRELVNHLRGSFQVRQ
jgi:DNA-directed RNA polymerase specialized sigma24 family protein